MINMNPIKKNDAYKYSWLDKPPVVPNDMALVLYPHDSREHCCVYLQDDTVFPEAIKKWHLDRLVHITLQAFEFQHSFRFPFSNGRNQWMDITYKFVVSVKPDKDAVKFILKNNVIDISEPILECLHVLTLERPYKSLDFSDLKTDALRKIRELLSRITYLKIQVSQVTSSVDDVSQKQIDDDKADEIRREEIEALKRKLERDKEEAEARRKEAEVARDKADTEKQLADIRHQAELEEQQHNINMKTKEVAAEKAYQLQQAENVAAVAQAQIQNIEKYGLESLAAIDSTYQGHINSRQARIDLERENKMKDLELAKQKILLVKEMVEAGVIDDMTAGQMTQQLLLGETQTSALENSASSTNSIEDKDVINISEDGKDVI